MCSKKPQSCLDCEPPLPTVPLPQQLGSANTVACNPPPGAAARCVHVSGMHTWCLGKTLSPSSSPPPPPPPPPLLPLLLLPSPSPPPEEVDGEDSEPDALVRTELPRAGQESWGSQGTRGLLLQLLCAAPTLFVSAPLAAPSPLLKTAAHFTAWLLLCTRLAPRPRSTSCWCVCAQRRAKWSGSTHTHPKDAGYEGNSGGASSGRPGTLASCVTPSSSSFTTLTLSCEGCDSGRGWERRCVCGCASWREERCSVPPFSIGSGLTAEDATTTLKALSSQPSLYFASSSVIQCHNYYE